MAEELEQVSLRPTKAQDEAVGVSESQTTSSSKQANNSETAGVSTSLSVTRLGDKLETPTETAGVSTTVSTQHDAERIKSETAGVSTTLSNSKKSFHRPSETVGVQTTVNTTKINLVDPQQVEGAQIEVFKPTNSTATPDFTIDASDILNIRVSERIQERVDEGTVVLDNSDGQFTGSQELTRGDKLVVQTQFSRESALTTRWTAMVTTLSYSRSNPTRSVIEVDAKDFVFGVMEDRNVYNAFEGDTITDIIKTMMQNEASEIGLDEVDTFSKTTDFFSNGMTLLNCVTEMVRRANAVMWSEGSNLFVKKTQEMGVSFTLDGTDKGGHQLDIKDNRLVNQIRVEGTTDHAIDDEQPTQTTTTTIDNTTRVTQQVSARTDEIDRVEVYTVKTGSGADFIVRIQADDGGAPVDVSDPNSDLARRRLDPTFVKDGGFTAFIMPKHGLQGSNPWLIVETDSANQQEVGTDGSGNLTYKTHHPFPIIVRASDRQSIDRYRRIENRRQDQQIETLDAAIDVARDVIRHDAEPEKEFSFRARSARAADLNIGEVIRVNEPNEQAVGPYIVTDKDTTYEDVNSVVELRLQETDTI